MSRAVAITIFCEDARAEISGSTTLVGVMPDRISIPSFPGAMSRLVAYTRILAPTATRIESLSTWLRFSDGREEGKQEFDVDFLQQTHSDALSSGTPNVGIIGTLIAAPFVLDAPIEVSAITCLNGEEFVSGYLNFVLEPSAPFV